MNIKSLTVLFLGLSIAAFSQKTNRAAIDPKATQLWDIVPQKVTAATTPGGPPSDAIVLFDGKNLSNWSTLKDSVAKWEIKDGILTAVKGLGDIKTKQKFGDIQLHIEWRTPAQVVGDSQGRGNSGIFFQERYELQILDNYENPTYGNGYAGSIYKQGIPMVNVCRQPGEWQTYDVIYMAPRFNDNGRMITQGTITVLQNGVLVQNHFNIWGPTEDRGSPLYEAHGKASLKLQDHNNPVSFRNIWVREL